LTWPAATGAAAGEAIRYADSLDIPLDALLRPIIGTRRRLFVVLLGCQPSPDQLRALEALAADTASTLWVSMEPYLQYTCATEPTVDEFLAFSHALTLVAGQLQHGTCLGRDTLLDMTRELMPRCCSKVHAPVWIGSSRLGSVRPCRHRCRTMRATRRSRTMR